MECSVFETLWSAWTKEWHNKCTCQIDIEETYETRNVYASQFCTIHPGVEKELWDRYESSKSKIKELYFYQDGKRLNKYKRAAVLTYIISSSSPLDYNEEEYQRIFGNKWSHLPDRLYLKQRLAFYIGLCSIVVEYDKTKVDKLQAPIFRYPELDKSEIMNGHKVDDFLQSVYKDLFFAEVYHNRNILTLANVFWLLTYNSKLWEIND